MSRNPANVAITRRVYDQGLPSNQNELVREMLDWFQARHDQGTNVGEFSDAVVLKSFGDVPKDLSEF
jgi:hypothetical protein